MEFKDLTPEQQEKANACATAGELADLAKSEGIELSDEQMDQLAGGWDSESYGAVYHCATQIRVPEGAGSVTCPVCGGLIIVNR